MIEREWTLDRVDEHLAGHRAHGCVERRPVGDDASVIGLDADLVGAHEGDAIRRGRFRGGVAMRLPHGDAGVVGVAVRGAVGPPHVVEDLPRIVGTSGQEEGCRGEQDMPRLRGKDAFHGGILRQTPRPGPDHSLATKQR